MRLTQLGVLVAISSLVAAAVSAPAVSAAPAAAAKKPTITSLSLAAGTPAGGSELRIDGTGLSSTKSVTVGGKRARIVGHGSGWVEVATPPHAGGTVQVRVSTADGRTAATRASRFRYFSPIAHDALQWSARKETNQRAGGALHVSCATTTFCVAVDTTGVLTQYDGSSWSKAQRVDLVKKAKADVRSAISQTSISCPLTTFCMLTDANGNAVSYDGTRWSAPTTIAPAQDLTVTCGSATFCLAFTTDEYLTYDGSSWSAPAPAPDPGFAAKLTVVSCAPARCLAAETAKETGPNTSALLTFDRSSWTNLGPPPFSYVNAVDCVTNRYCVFDGGYGDRSLGQAAAVVGNTVSHTWVMDNNETMGAISCATKSYCVARQGFFDLVRFAGGKWTQLSGNTGRQKEALASVSCPAPRLCLIGSSAAAGDPTSASVASSVGVYRGGDSVPELNAVMPTVGFQSTSCVTPAFCMNAGSGAAFVYDGSTFRTPAFPTPQSRYAASSVSCTSRSFCVFASGGRTAIYNGTRWTTDTKVDPVHLAGVSCGSRSFCAAYDTHGRVLTYNGSAWTTPQRVDGARLHSLSCAGSSLCAAADTRGAVMIYRHHHWGGRHIAFVSTFGDDVPAVVSCASATLCVAVDGLGNAARYDGTRWHKAIGVATPRSRAKDVQFDAPPLSRALIAVSCLSNQFCRAIDEHGSYVFDGKRWTGHQQAPLGLSNQYISQDVSCPTSRWCFAADTARNSLSQLPWDYRIGSR